MKRSTMIAALGLAGASLLAATPAAAQFSLNISVNVAPPALPVYDQPPIPAPDEIWIPGYWAWDDDFDDYYWVPGTWMLAPRPGLLWTPPWWGWQNGVYLFHQGYWGPHVGFYGGVSYGFGYTGAGYQGAYWNGGHVFYNQSVTNVRNVNITNVYNKTVVVNRITNVSYNGGPGGLHAQPSVADQQAAHEVHVAPPPAQIRHVQAARADRQLFASANHGRPPIAAAPKPGQLNGPGVVTTRHAPAYLPRSGAAHGPDNGQERPPQLSHLPPARAEMSMKPAPDDPGSATKAPTVRPNPFHDEPARSIEPPIDHEHGIEHRPAPEAPPVSPDRANRPHAEAQSFAPDRKPPEPHPAAFRAEPPPRPHPAPPPHPHTPAQHPEPHKEGHKEH